MPIPCKGNLSPGNDHRINPRPAYSGAAPDCHDPVALLARDHRLSCTPERRAVEFAAGFAAPQDKLGKLHRRVGSLLLATVAEVPSGTARRQVHRRPRCVRYVHVDDARIDSSAASPQDENGACRAGRRRPPLGLLRFVQLTSEAIAAERFCSQIATQLSAANARTVLCTFHWESRLRLAAEDCFTSIVRNESASSAARDVRGSCNPRLLAPTAGCASREESGSSFSRLRRHRVPLPSGSRA
jgi:hypothetical protein